MAYHSILEVMRRIFRPSEAYSGPKARWAMVSSGSGRAGDSRRRRRGQAGNGCFYRWPARPSHAFKHATSISLNLGLSMTRLYVEVGLDVVFWVIMSHTFVSQLVIRPSHLIQGEHRLTVTLCKCKTCRQSDRGASAGVSGYQRCASWSMVTGFI